MKVVSRLTGYGLIFVGVLALLLAFNQTGPQRSDPFNQSEEVR